MISNKFKIQKKLVDACYGIFKVLHIVKHIGHGGQCFVWGLESFLLNNIVWWWWSLIMLLSSMASLIVEELLILLLLDCCKGPTPLEEEWIFINMDASPSNFTIQPTRRVRKATMKSTNSFHISTHKTSLFILEKENVMDMKFRATFFASV